MKFYPHRSSAYNLTRGKLNCYCSCSRVDRESVTVNPDRHLSITPLKIYNYLVWNILFECYKLGLRHFYRLIIVSQIERIVTRRLSTGLYSFYLKSYLSFSVYLPPIRNQHYRLLFFFFLFLLRTQPNRLLHSLHYTHDRYTYTQKN